MTFVWWAAMLGCGSGASAPTEAPAWGAAKWTQSRKYQVTVRALPEPVPMGELFAMQATITDPSGAPLERAKVKLDARMPQHNHGMETEPKSDPGSCVDGEDGAQVCTFPGGVYTAQGFKFHMGGEWTVLVEVDGPVGVDSTSFVYDLRP